MASTIPKSPTNSTVSLSIIDSTTRISNISTKVFLDPVHPTFKHLSVPAYSFLIEHAPSSSSPATPTRLVFDLALRKDHTSLAPSASLSSHGWTIDVPSDVPTILTQNGIPLSTISGIIWSHWHSDHSGNPALFPTSVPLIVGPGFKAGMLPGYPTRPDALVLDSDFAGRDVVELFSQDAGGSGGTTLEIAGLRALDYFGDGSFYILDAPGHAIGHVMGLARVTSDAARPGEDTFVLLGADTCHHTGQFRPSEGHPFPETVDPATLNDDNDPHLPSALLRSSNLPAHLSFPCPGALLLNHAAHLDSATARTEPFFTMLDVPDGQGLNVNRNQALAAREALMQLDASDQVFTVIAHDGSLLDVVEFFPKTANDWRQKGWGVRGKWEFLKDFCQ